MAMSTVIKNIKQNKYLPAHSVSIEIYSGIQCRIKVGAIDAAALGPFQK